MKQFFALAVIALSFLACGNGNAQNKQAASGQQTFIQLGNGLQMPQFGIGTFGLPSNEVAKNSVLTALKLGYRHIDTAHSYNDERGVGEGIKESGVPREEIWLTSKLWPSDYNDGKTLEHIDEMLERLQVDYVDLLYIHQPIGNYVEAWKAMEKAVELGKVRTLGISNFDLTDEGFQTMVEQMTIKPAILQIECHPYAQRLQMREKAARYGLAVECWFPLGGQMSQKQLLNDPVIKAIGEAHGKTAAQTIIRWHIQEGLSVIPGSSNPAHIAENLDVFDFSLTDAEMEQIRALNKEQRYFNMPLEALQQFVNGRNLEN